MGNCFDNTPHPDKEPNIDSLKRPLLKNESASTTTALQTSSTAVSTNNSNATVGNPNDVILPSSKSNAKITVNDFKILNLLGEGNFGKVYLVQKHDTQNIYAMKMLSKVKLKEANQLEHTITERSVLQHVDHPFLVTLHYAFQTPEKLYMVMDFVSGGELFFHLRKEKKFSEKRARFYASEILLALEKLHSLQIIYRDLKPENLLIDSDGHIKLTDFGLSKILRGNARTHTFCGTPEYLAPEIVLQKGHGKPVDYWSLGTLLYEMIVGIPPFYSKDVQEMYRKILHADLVIPDYVSVEGQDLLARLLERNPKRRLGSNGVDEVKNHPFFSSINWDDILNKRVTPEFKPKIKSDKDTSYFDEEFTRKTVNKDSFPGGNGKLQDNQQLLNQRDQKVFVGFTFNEDGKLKASKSDNDGDSYEDAEDEAVEGNRR